MGMPESIISHMESASSQEIYFLEEDELERYQYEPALEEWLIAKCDTGLTKEENAERKRLSRLRNRGEALNVTQKIALESLEGRGKQWANCRMNWLLDFRSQRQGLD